MNEVIDILKHHEGYAKLMKQELMHGQRSQSGVISFSLLSSHTAQY